MAFTILAMLAVMLTGLALLVLGAQPKPRRLPVRVRERDPRYPHR